MFGNFFNFKIQNPQILTPYIPKPNLNISPKFKPFTQYNNIDQQSTKKQIPKLSNNNLKCFYDMIVDIDNQIENLKNMKTKIEEIIKQVVESGEKNKTTEINKIYDEQLTDSFMDTHEQTKIQQEHVEPINQKNVTVIPFVPNQKKKKKPILNPIQEESKEITLEENIQDSNINNKEINDQKPETELKSSQQNEENQIIDNVDLNNNEQSNQETKNINQQTPDVHDVIDVDNMLNEQLESVENQQTTKRKLKIQEEFVKEFDIKDGKNLDIEKIIKKTDENKLMNVLVNSIQKSNL